MKFGPFPQGEVPIIEAVLNRAGIRFQVLAEESAGANSDAGKRFVDIYDEDVDKLDPELEKLGFSLNLPVPDFHNTDFVCPKCGHSQEEPGTCPNDGDRLLEFSDYAALQRTAGGPSNRSFYVALTLALIVGAIAYFWVKG